MQTQQKTRILSTRPESPAGEANGLALALAAPFEPSPGATGSGLRDFLSLQGARVLFCCSVVCVLYGMLRILGPLLALDGALSRKLPAFGALNGYELALFVVLALLALWRRKLSDAPLLVMLTAVLATACGLALDTLVNDSVRAGYVLGTGCLALGLLKQGFLSRFIGVPLRGALFAASALLLAANFLWNGALAQVLRNRPCNEAALVAGWRWGWMAVLAAGVALWVRALPAFAAAPLDDESERPYLRRDGMAWLVAAILLVGSGVHAVSLGYIFDIASAWNDYLPFLLVLSALTQEFLRRPQFAVPSGVATSVAALPVLAVGWAGLGGPAVCASSTWLEFAWYPTALMALATAWLLTLYVRTRRDGLLATTTVAFSLLLLLAGGAGADAAPLASVRGASFWVLLGGLLAAVGLWRGRVPLAMVGAMTASIAASTMDPVVRAMASVCLPLPASVFVMLGLALVTMTLLMGRRVPVVFAIFAAAVLAAGLWQAQGPWWTWTHGAWTLCCALSGLALWARTGSRAAGAILVTPVLRLLSAGHQATGGWAYVGLGFALLATGAWQALRRREGARAET